MPDTIRDDSTDTIQVTVQKVKSHNSNLQVVWKLIVEDVRGVEGELLVFKRSDVASLDFKPGEWYELRAIEMREGNPVLLSTTPETTGERIDQPTSDSLLDATEGVARFLHVGDTHLGHHSTDSTAERYTRDPLGRVVDVAIQQDVDAVLHTGNLEQGNGPLNSLSPRTVAALDTLAEAQVGFYYLDGRQDPAEDRWHSELAAHEATTHLSADHVNVAGTALYGVDDYDETWWRDPKLDFDHPGDSPSVVCLHRLTSDVAGASSSTTAVADLLQVLEFEPAAVALGYEGITAQQTVEGIPACYAGSDAAATDNTSGEDLTVNRLTVSSDGATVDQIALNTRPANPYTVRLAPGTTRIELRKKIGSLSIPDDRVFVNLIGAHSKIDATEVCEAFEEAGARSVRVVPVDSGRATDLVPGIYAANVDDLNPQTDAPEAPFERAARARYRVGTELPDTEEDSPYDYEAAASELEENVPGKDVLAGEDLLDLCDPSPDAILREGTCAFYFDPEAWSERTGYQSDTDVPDDVWECPHDAPADEAYCVFHRPLSEKSPGEARDAMLAAVANSKPRGRRCQFIGASFHKLSLGSRTLSASHQATIDLSHAAIKGPFSFDGGVLDQPLTARFARFDGAVNPGNQNQKRSVFTGPVDVSWAVFSETVSFDDTAFEARPLFTNTRFCDSASFTGTRFEGGMYASRAIFEDKANFQKAQFGDNVTFYGTLFRGDFEVRRARFHRESAYSRAQFHGDVDAFMLRADDRAWFRGALFAGDQLNFERAHFDGPLSFTDVRFTLDGDVSFTEATINGVFEAANAVGEASAMTFDRVSFSRIVTWENAELTVEDVFSLAQSSVAGELTFTDSEIRGEVKLNRAQFGGFVDCTNWTVTGELVFDESRAAGGLDLTNANLKGGATLAETRIDGSFTCTDVTLDEDATLVLQGTVIAGTTTLDGADFDGKVDGETFEPRGRVTAGNADFEEATFKHAVFAKNANFEDATFHGTADFTQAVFEMRLVLTDAVFHHAGVFCEATIETAELTEAKSGTGDTLIDFGGATVQGGVLGQPENSTVLYELTNATLGDVTLIGETESGREPSQFDRYGIYNTRFDGFDFAKHESVLADNDWVLHRFTRRGETTASDLERTYRNAKAGAASQGYTRGESGFFSKVMRYRGGRLEEQGGRTERWAHKVLGGFSNYGESPPRVIGSSLAIVGVYAVVFAIAEFGLRLYDAGPGAAVSPWIDGAFPPFAFLGTLVSYLVMSMEAFTTLVLGGGRAVAHPGLRLLATSEGFLGAFMIALFLFTLTRVIDR